MLAPSTPGALGVVKSRTGFGVRVKCADYVSVRSKLYPDWVPQQDTPYNKSLPLKYELHHVHPGAGKGDLQALVNSLPWGALVLRQTRPCQWLVASDCPPPKDSILTQHGCILIQSSTLPVEKSFSKGQGKGSKGKGPSWLLGKCQDRRYHDPPPGLAVPQPSVPCPPDVHGPIKKAALELEQRMEERFAAMRDESAATHSLMKRDIQDLRQEL